jgi:hypothetical protein
MMMKIKVGEHEVVLDPKHLEISEEGMNDFLKNFAGLYNYYHMMWSKAQYLHYKLEDRHDVLLAERYQWYKENEGGSDKLAEAKARISEQVIQAKKSARDAKYVMQVLNSYIRALDKAHENALNLGYNIRKEIGHLFPQEVRGPLRTAAIDAEIAKFFEEEPQEKPVE